MRMASRVKRWTSWNSSGSIASILPRRNIGRYLTGMQTPEPVKNSPDTLPDLILNFPTPDVELPAYHDFTIEEIWDSNEELWKHTVYDEAYFAQSLAGKNPEPFVM
jgi:hypothetical protein